MDKVAESLIVIISLLASLITIGQFFTPAFRCHKQTDLDIKI